MGWGQSRRQTKRLLTALLWVAAASGCGAKQRSQPPATAAAVSRTPQQATGELAQFPERAKCEPVSAHFGYDDSELSVSARETLANYQRCVQQLGAERVRVRGMTDPRGTEEYNLALGERRASAAARYLTALGVPRVEPSSVGEELAQGGDEASWENDRRADVMLP